MKTLVIVAHPNLPASRINNRWVQELRQQENVTVHNLYAAYPDGKIDVSHEQASLLAHDRIVFQFPFQWYSSPALLKQWQDDVLEFGWAFGRGGDKLHGKDLVLAISTGGPKAAYDDGGRNLFTIHDLLRPFQATAKITGMEMRQPFLLHGARMVTGEQLEASAREYAAYVTNPICGQRIDGSQN